MADYPRFLAEGVFDKEVMDIKRQRARAKRRDQWKVRPAPVPGCGNDERSAQLPRLAAFYVCAWQDDHYEAFWGEKKGKGGATLDSGGAAAAAAAAAGSAASRLPEHRPSIAQDPILGRPRTHADTYYTRLSFWLPDYAGHLAQSCVDPLVVGKQGRTLRRSRSVLTVLWGVKWLRGDCALLQEKAKDEPVDTLLVAAVTSPPPTASPAAATAAETSAVVDDDDAMRA